MAALKNIVTSLSPFEAVVFWVLVGLIIASGLGVLARINNTFLIEVEARGGSFTEGIVGSPRFINPVLALSDADRDLVSLVYSGLMKATPEGDLVPDLAESYTISEDGLTYTFTIREDAVFHDNTPVTADDVIFTVEKTLDPTLKSSQRANWDGVRVEKLSDRTVEFTLASPYAPFLHNTTIGILPKHIWGNIDSDQFPFSDINIHPIGSGPYQVKKVSKNSSGIPELYTLRSFNDYTLGRPYISTITLKFYPNEDALVTAFEKGRVDTIGGISPESTQKFSHERTLQTPLLRIFAVFFNQNIAQVFSNIEVRKALDTAVNKSAIVNQVLAGYGTVIDGPIPPGSITPLSEDADQSSYTGDIEEAKDILLRNGWTFDEEEQVWKSEDEEPLRFSLTTSNVPELKSVASLLEEAWEEMGADVEVKVFEAGNLSQNVIRPREYEALLFGEVIGRELDLFAFWHSSQRNDPGLNIAQYANITADSLLEEGRTTLDIEARDAAYHSFEEEVRNDLPSIFLYSPDFVYILPQKIRGASLGSVTTSGDRFLSIHKWYIRTDNVWKIFSRK